MLLLQCCALRKFHVTDGQKVHDQITSDRRSKRMWSKCALCIPYILSASPNECWLHTCNACVIRTWRLGLRAPLLACKKLIIILIGCRMWIIPGTGYQLNTESIIIIIVILLKIMVKIHSRLKSQHLSTYIVMPFSGI